MGLLAGCRAVVVYSNQLHNANSFNTHYVLAQYEEKGLYALWLVDDTRLEHYHSGEMTQMTTFVGDGITDMAANESFVLVKRDNPKNSEVEFYIGYSNPEKDNPETYGPMNLDDYEGKLIELLVPEDLKLVPVLDFFSTLE